MTHVIHYAGSLTDEHNSISFVCHFDVNVFCGLCFGSLCAQSTTILVLFRTLRMAYSANMTVCRQERLQCFTQLKYLHEDKGLQLICNMADG